MRANLGPLFRHRGRRWGGLRHWIGRFKGAATWPASVCSGLVETSGAAGQIPYTEFSRALPLGGRQKPSLFKALGALSERAIQRVFGQFIQPVLCGVVVREFGQRHRKGRAV